MTEFDEKIDMWYSSMSVQQGRKPIGKDKNSSVFINHAAHSWLENRKRWIADQSRRMKAINEDPIISWSTTYEEELLSTNRAFSVPIPLPEMVDFLVDIWHDEGLFD